MYSLAAEPSASSPPLSAEDILTEPTATVTVAECLDTLAEEQERLHERLRRLEQAGRPKGSPTVAGSPRGTVSNTTGVPSDAQVSPTPAPTPPSSPSDLPTTLIYRAVQGCSCALPGKLTLVDPITIRCEGCGVLWDVEPIPVPGAEPAT